MNICKALLVTLLFASSLVSNAQTAIPIGCILYEMQDQAPSSWENGSPWDPQPEDFDSEMRFYRGGSVVESSTLPARYKDPARSYPYWLRMLFGLVNG